MIERLMDFLTTPVPVWALAVIGYGVLRLIDMRIDAIGKAIAELKAGRGDDG